MVASGIQDKNFEYNDNSCIVSWLYTKPFPFVNSHKMTQMYENGDEPKDMGEIADVMSFRMSNSEGILINFKNDFTKEDWKHIHPDGLRFKDDRLQIANPDGYVLTATQMGDTPEEAGKKLDELLKKIVIPKGFWRNDFDKSNFHKCKDDLEKWGYAISNTAKRKIQLEKGEELKNEEKRKKVREVLKKIVI